MCFALLDRMPPDADWQALDQVVRVPSPQPLPCVNALPETKSKEGLSSGGLTSMLRLADAAERPRRVCQQNLQMKV